MKRKCFPIFDVRGGAPTAACSLICSSTTAKFPSTACPGMDKCILRPSTSGIPRYVSALIHHHYNLTSIITIAILITGRHHHRCHRHHHQHCYQQHHITVTT